MSFHYDEIRAADGVFTFIDKRQTERPKMVEDECFKSSVSVDENGPVDFHLFYPVVATNFTNALTGASIGDKVEWVDLPAIVKRRFKRWEKRNG